MDRRQMLRAMPLAAVTTGMGAAESGSSKPSYLELKIWYLENSPDQQASRLSAYIEGGLAPAIARAGARFAAALSSSIGPEAPYFVTLAEFDDLLSFEKTLALTKEDPGHRAQLEKLSTGGRPGFKRMESMLLRSFDVKPRADIKRAPAKRVFELRTYEAPGITALARKIKMFNDAEAAIFERLGMQPVFFGETLAGPRQPSLVYMLSFSDLAARERLWGTFVADPEWKRISAPAEVHDSELVRNISNVLLEPLPFSPLG